LVAPLAGRRFGFERVNRGRVSAGKPYYVESLARPGANATGFAAFEFSISGKWLELLKETAPGVKRVAVIRDPSVPGGSGGLAAIQTVAPSFGVELTAVGVRIADEIERGIMAFARSANSGLIMVGPPSLVQQYRNLIVTLASRHRLPAVYSNRTFVTDGGLISYDPDPVDQYWRAAAYVDRILKGEKPADLPVQTPSKYELVLNMKTAKALGLTVPPTLLARADQVIEYRASLEAREIVQRSILSCRQDVPGACEIKGGVSTHGRRAIPNLTVQPIQADVSISHGELR
jgi:putative ABC transport system substrate-binding protein